MPIDNTDRAQPIDVGELHKRLGTIKEELTALHREMYWMVQDQRGPEQQQNIDELNFDQIMEFKLAVDNMRELLWKYVAAAATVEPRQVQQAMETHQVRRVSHLLQLLRERLSDNTEQPVSFIEKVTAVVTDKLAQHDDQAA